MSLLKDKILQTAADVVRRLTEQVKSGKADPWATRSFTHVEDGIEYEVDIKIRIREPK